MKWIMDDKYEKYYTFANTMYSTGAWRAVNEELPPLNEEVLVIREYQSGKREIGIDSRIERSNGYGWIWGKLWRKSIQIIYWMPLPKMPPK